MLSLRVVTSLVACCTLRWVAEDWHTLTLLWVHENPDLVTRVPQTLRESEYHCYRPTAKAQLLVPLCCLFWIWLELYLHPCSHGHWARSLTTPQTSACTCLYWHGFTKIPFFFFVARQPVVGLGLLYEVPRSHSRGLLWTSNRPAAETSTWQHTTLTRDRRPYTWWDSNTQSQQASCRRPTP
jgi:hypothetical protein